MIASQLDTFRSTKFWLAHGWLLQTRRFYLKINSTTAKLYTIQRVLHIRCPLIKLHPQVWLFKSSVANTVVRSVYMKKHVSTALLIE